MKKILRCALFLATIGAWSACTAIPTKAIPTSGKKALLDPTKVTDVSVKQKNQEVLTIRKQLATQFNQNPSLQNLVKEKKNIQKKIDETLTTIEKQQEKNKAKRESYQKIKAAGTVPPNVEQDMKTMRDTVKKLHGQLNKYHNDLWDIKQKISKAAPTRRELFKKLHKAKHELQTLTLMQEAQKIPDRK